MAKDKKCILVTGSGGPLGVNVTRSLLQAPEKMRIVGTECNPYHTYLSLTDKTVIIPPAKDKDNYISAMQSLIKDEKIDMLLPTHPVEVRTISENRKQFADVRTHLPEHQTILTAQNKWETHKLLKDGGLPVPKTAFIHKPEDIEAFFNEVTTRPIWVRGAGVPGAGIGVASLPCREIEHAKAWIDHWQGWGYFIASEFLPGRNLTWCGLYKAGDLIASQSRERLEYVLPHVSPSGITGAPAVSKTITDTELNKVGAAAVSKLSAKPNGVFFVDLKEDSKSQARITEINGGRFGTTIHFYTEAGCNFPYLLVKLAFDEEIAEAPLIDPIEPNTYWIRTLDCGPAMVRGLEE